MSLVIAHRSTGPFPPTLARAVQVCCPTKSFRSPSVRTAQKKGILSHATEPFSFFMRHWAMLPVSPSGLLRMLPSSSLHTSHSDDRFAQFSWLSPPTRLQHRSSFPQVTRYSTILWITFSLCFRFSAPGAPIISQFLPPVPRELPLPSVTNLGLLSCQLPPFGWCSATPDCP